MFVGIPSECLGGWFAGVLDNCVVVGSVASIEGCTEVLGMESNEEGIGIVVKEVNCTEVQVGTCVVEELGLLFESIVEWLKLW